ncbi:UDP-glycosyltransferase 92A1-like [Impatiens glandulifera]|uniref:UDP-glycosyltransferase 92A1-like n=1 Tax=Impatiens glandulifera TaxID=253017 RepID=UPI001FB0A0D0|nr:UDP-glycosyltransferase 92A1-like [Impatiens glandulifera]
MSSEKTKTKGSIVMFPFMAQGHIIPFLALAFQIEKRGYNIIFITTPLNIKNLKPLIPPSSTLRLLPIPFDPTSHGLPPTAENTDTLPYPLIIRLLQASLSFKQPFRNILSNLIDRDESPLCVIADIFFGWSAQISSELGIFNVIFSGAGGFGLGCYYSVWLNLPHRESNSLQEFSLPDFPEAGTFHVTQLAASFLAADGKDDWSIFQRENLPGWRNSDGILFNSVDMIDEKGFLYFKRKLGIPVWPIGPILLSGDNGKKQVGVSREICVQWMDSKPVNSVLFIAFGSQNTITATQMMRLANAIERIEELNFIWVVRPPLGFDINSEFKPDEWLPEGFMNRLCNDQNRGLIAVQWAPQMEILSHNSVGGFITHCGWNSVLEALSCGVPLIGWPMAAEQFFNAKFLEEEMGVCVEVARGTNFEVRVEDIERKIGKVMKEGSEIGMEMRRKAGEVGSLIKDAIRDDGSFKGSSVRAMDQFLEAARLKTKKSSCSTK